MAGYFRRLSRQFSISAPRMAVRTHLGWPWKLLATLGFALVIAGMWWWGFDFGQLLGGFNRREVEQRIAQLEAEAAAAREESTDLRARNAELESELAMMRGAQAEFSKQQLAMMQETARLKEELAFFQQFFADSTRTPGVSIQRFTVDGAEGPVVRYSVLLVRGGTTKADFEGILTLQADLVAAADSGTAPMTLMLPADAPETTGPLTLKFKYYQRVEGTFAIPPAYAVRTLTARVYESGIASPRFSRTLTLP